MPGTSDTVRTAAGRRLALGAEIGRGGEGAVYRIEGEDGIAAKIYPDAIAADRRDKIHAMVAGGWHRDAASVAFPIETLSDGEGRFCGFTMRLVSGHKPVHHLYSPTSRKDDFPKAGFRFLLRAGLNIARAVAGVNATGCVIGDVNHSGILVSQKATVALIDCDSFQVATGGRTYPCKVGVIEYTPPELQGRRLDTVVRTGNHDAFGLAVCLFYLLFMGRHPYAGRYTGHDDMTTEKAIREFRFAYSVANGSTRMEPPPNVPRLSYLPPALAEAFERAFGSAGAIAGSSGGARPSAARWVELLEAAEKALVQCPKKPSHQHFRADGACPWCSMEAAYPGFLCFAPPSPRYGTPVDIGETLAALEAVEAPREMVPFWTVLPDITTSPGSGGLFGYGGWVRSYVGALAAAATAFETFHLGLPYQAAGAGLLAWAGWLVFRPRRPSKRSLDRLARGQAAYADLERRWLRLSQDDTWPQAKARADDLVRQFRDLGRERSRRMASVAGAERQLERHLRARGLGAAVIPGVDAMRKVTLRAYGIETAADVNEGTLARLPGLPEVSRTALLIWRRGIERRFVPKPSASDPADVAAVDAEMAARRHGIEHELRELLMRLRAVSGQMTAARAEILKEAKDVWPRLRHAEIDDERRASEFASPWKKWAFAPLAAALFVAVHLANLAARERGWIALPAATPSVAWTVPANSAALPAGCRIEQCSEAVRARPADPQVYYDRATAYRLAGDYRRSIADYDTALSLDGRSAAAYRGRGTAHLGARDYAAAEADYSRALALVPDAGTNRNLCYARLQARKLSDAIASCSEAIRLDASDPKPHLYRALALHMLGRLEAAISDYDAAIGLDPHEASAFTGRGNAYGAKNDAVRAAADHREAARLTKAAN